VGTAGEAVGELRKLLTAVRDSRPLRTLLRATLAVGNFINGGSKRGGAWAFRLSAIPKMQTNKSIDGKTNILRVCVVEAALLAKEERAARAESFVADLSRDVAALANSRISPAQVKEITAELAKAYDTLARNVFRANDMDLQDDDEFVTAVGGFVEEAEAVVDALRQDVNALDEEFRGIVKFFGENPARFAWDDLVATASLIHAEAKVVNAKLITQYTS
jgi:hypothetical protein